ncbi:MAG: hypothetical protein HRU19_27020 [Pseudobacteriovorax sp.]|nr:hypothetical protein [Pseudobacteriovorax sp.]
MGRLIFILLLLSQVSWAKSVEHKFFQMKSYYPFSYDPLDADLINNMYVAKLRNLSPIELDHNNNFRSQVLESFNYDYANASMKWVVNTHLKFSNGESLTPDDIILSIKRMAFTRPKFPVLGDIKGIAKWAKEGNFSKPIDGLRKEGNLIEITFRKKIANPFFQFTLPIFSILPQSCFEKNSPKMTCKKPPALGYYDFIGYPKIQKVKNRGHYPDIGFKLRPGFDQVHGYPMPKIILLVYRSTNRIKEILQEMDEFAVLETSNIRLSDKVLNDYRKEVNIKRMPLTSLNYIVLNPSMKPFDDRDCRKLFIDAFRKNYAAVSNKIDTATISFPSELMPGYLLNSDLEKAFRYSDKKNYRRRCLTQFSQTKLPYRKLRPGRTDFFWDKIAADTLSSLNSSTDGFYGKSSVTDGYSVFSKDETAFIPAVVEFWPVDLVAGFKMFFTPGMHSILKYVTNDQSLQNIVDRLFVETDPKESKKIFAELNLFLNQQALIVPLSHYGLVYISKNSHLTKTVISTGEPSPWHLFKRQ